VPISFKYLFEGYTVDLRSSCTGTICFGAVLLKDVPTNNALFLSSVLSDGSLHVSCPGVSCRGWRFDIPAPCVVYRAIIDSPRFVRESFHRSGFNNIFCAFEDELTYRYCDYGHHVIEPGIVPVLPVGFSFGTNIGEVSTPYGTIVWAKAQQVICDSPHHGAGSFSFSFNYYWPSRRAVLVPGTGFAELDFTVNSPYVPIEKKI